MDKIVEENKINAEVISVFPNKVKISVDDLTTFKIAEESLKVSSYLRISDNENSILIAIIENFSIEVNNNGDRKYIIDALPLGMIEDGKFKRGGDTIAIPPKEVTPASLGDIKKIFMDSIDESKRFSFAKLSTNKDIEIPVDGNKFFNKHISIIGSTGSGKSHTVAKILQNVVDEKFGNYSLNNSHIIIFDIHSEYKSAFPNANYLDIENLVLPYWLLNNEELEEILLDTGERDNYNQSSIFRTLVTANKKKHNTETDRIFYDSPVFFDINEVLNAINNLKKETINAKSLNRYMIKENNDELLDLKTDKDSGIELDDKTRFLKYFVKEYDFYNIKSQNISKGGYNDGTLEKFSFRLTNKIKDKRLDFLFGERTKMINAEKVLRQIMGYNEPNKSNVTIIDLSGIPFEVLSITVSLISRLIFEYGYFYKRYRHSLNTDETINNDIPILLVYEEAHKYVPKSELSKYRSSQKAIERIAKEGRKYGVTLMLASQRPSEISETIFSQCNNFVVMRLTNPNDQNYVKKLLPDTLGKLIDKLPSLSVGEALLIGESIIMPSIVSIDKCELYMPSSNDIPYFDLWKEEWRDLTFDELLKEWTK
jgi:Predicted ATPase